MKANDHRLNSLRLRMQIRNSSFTRHLVTLQRRMTGRPTNDGSGEKTNAVLCAWGLGEGRDRGSGPPMHARSPTGSLQVLFLRPLPQLYTQSGSSHRQGRAEVASGLFARLLVATKGEVTSFRVLPVRQETHPQARTGNSQGDKIQ